MDVANSDCSTSHAYVIVRYGDWKKVGRTTGVEAQHEARLTIVAAERYPGKRPELEFSNSRPLALKFRLPSTARLLQPRECLKLDPITPPVDPTHKLGETDPILPTTSVASGLITAQQLDYCLRVARHRLKQQGLPEATTVPDSLLSEILIEQKLLTKYQADQLLAGRTKFYLGPYLITDWIGAGGMGQVFKAVHQVMGRECAVKVLLPKSRATAESRESFAREIRMQAKLDSPYLVRAFDAGQDGVVHYLVTEYVPGMDLRRLVKTQGALPAHQAAKIVMQAALGLQYAHSQGMVHRDVKPGNVLVTPAGDAKVSDVGLAGFAKELMSDPRAGKIVGTADYLSPEQISTPLEVQPTSDIYSLGCTLYYAVCGKVPFPGGDTTSKLRRHLDETPWHPRKFTPDLTEDFVDIIADMMEKDPRKRISSAAEVAARLEPWAAESYQLGPATMPRSPWMAPPLPSHAADRIVDELNPASGLNSSSLLSEPQQVDTSRGLNSKTLSATAAGPAAGTQFDSDSLSAGNLPSGSLAPGVAPPVPAPPPALPSSFTEATAQPAAHAGMMSTGMMIALTLAIAVPPTLLLGAILGYLAAQ